MRRITILLAVILILPVCAQAKDRTDKCISQESLMQIIDTYGNEEGFEVVYLGGMATSAIRTMLRIAAHNEDDPEVREAIKIIKGIKKITVIEYEDVNAATREKITGKLDKLMESAELLMEVKEEDGLMRMYGVVSDDSKTISNFVLYVPEDYTLICLFGTISADAISKMMK